MEFPRGVQTRAVVYDPFKNHISHWSISQALSADGIQLQQIVAISQEISAKEIVTLLCHAF